MRQLSIEFNPSDYIDEQAYIIDITFYARHCNVLVEYDIDNQNYTDIVLDKVGDYVGKSVPLAIHKKTGNVYRKELVIGYQDISLFIVGVCLLLLENYAYANKKKGIGNERNRKSMNLMYNNGC